MRQPLANPCLMWGRMCECPSPALKSIVIALVRAILCT